MRRTLRTAALGPLDAAGARAALFAAALALPCAAMTPAARAGEGAEGSSACGVPGFLDDDDEGLRLAYDGLRRGLEEANLPRICLRRPAHDDAAGWDRLFLEVSAEKPPFVVALGRRSAARVAAARLEGPSGRVPCVYVDVATVVGGRALPAVPALPTPGAVVRAEVPVEAWGPLLRALLPGRPQPTVLLPWTAETKEAAALRREAARGGGFEARVPADGPATPDAILDWSPGAGETVEPFAATLERARTLRVPLLSGEHRRFGHGVAVALLPDAPLLGRVAADAARRLVEGERDPGPLRLSSRSTEVCVDLEAADAEGFAPPLPFLAAAHRLRQARVTAPAPAGEPGAPGAPPAPGMDGR